jgi:hypothetical protein
MSNKTGIPVSLGPGRHSTQYFDLQEYHEFNKAFDSGFSFPKFCFFRKNLPANFSVEKIVNYFNSIWDDKLFSKLEIPSTQIGKGYELFEKDFFAGKYEVRDEVRLPGIDPVNHLKEKL